MKKVWESVKAGMVFWLKLMQYMAIAAAPGILLVLGVEKMQPHNYDLKIAVVLVSYLLAMALLFWGLGKHNKWFSLMRQRQYEEKRTNEMAKSLSLEELVKKAEAGEFPYRCDKSWA